MACEHSQAGMRKGLLQPPYSREGCDTVADVIELYEEDSSYLLPLDQWVTRVNYTERLWLRSEAIAFF
jgi:hypothetical protein